jgi:quinol monooxygenase YgiN
MNQSVLLKIHLVISPNKRREFLRSIKELSGSQQNLSPKENGCITKSLYQFIDDENAFCYMEEWNSQRNMKRYLQSDIFRALIGAIKVLGEVKEWQTYILSK